MDRVKGFPIEPFSAQHCTFTLSKNDIDSLSEFNMLTDIGDSPLAVLGDSDGELCGYANNYTSRFYSEYCDAFEYMLRHYNISDIDSFSPDWDRYPVATCLYHDGLIELRSLLKRIIISCKEDLHELFACLRTAGAFLELPYDIDEDTEVVLLDSVSTLRILLEAEGLVLSPYRDYALRNQPHFEDIVITNKNFQLAA